MKMVKKVTLANYLNLEELYHKYRCSNNAISRETKQLKAKYPQCQIELWCEDEHRLGLKPIMRRIYVPEGEQPVAKVNWRF